MKIPVTILGATGVIGQHYVSLLHNHPWFEIASLVASRPADDYREAVEGKWSLSKPIPEGYSLHSLETFTPTPLIFSALPSSLAASVERQLADTGSYVISSASCHRLSAPVVIPEINPHHIGSSRLITKPNCALQSFLLPLAPLHKLAPIRALSVTTLQALSGAGTQALHWEAMEDSVIPFIEGEEEKLEREPLKILEAEFPISAQCTRVPISHGHLACISVRFSRPLTRDEILAAWSTPTPLTLPSAPRFPVHYLEQPDRPQTRLDREAGKGMSVSIGRLRPCPLFDWRFVALSHNAIRGGAGGGVLIAELLKQQLEMQHETQSPLCQTQKELSLS